MSGRRRAAVFAVALVVWSVLALRWGAGIGIAEGDPHEPDDPFWAQMGLIAWGMIWLIGAVSVGTATAVVLDLVSRGRRSN